MTMNKYYMESMLRNLSENDRELLQMIYEPKVVAVPPWDASRNLCVGPDGEIRLYGSFHRKHELDPGIIVYLSSKDCGLSWKTHLVKGEGVLGSAGYNPNTGRYITSYPNEYRRDLEISFARPGTWAIISDEGFDSTNNRYVLITEMDIHIMKNPFYLESCNRWFLMGEYTNEDYSMQIVVFYSDDDGETWTTNLLEKSVPVFPVEEPHKGLRWQQYSCEPTIVESVPGELLMIVRTTQNFHYQYKSYDYGATWTDPEPSVFHGTNTMPILYKLSDGRLIFFWCNNELMPELNHELTWPPLSNDEKAGIWEDVFTNRDANHMAISEDGGKTWKGFREVRLNGIRNRADYRSAGEIFGLDKSVHQAQIVELPFNKLLIHFGQNSAARRVMILDIDWLYEQDRHENFREGMRHVSTHMYVKSNLGGFRGFSGHCAYNRTNGALLVPDPEGNFQEVLQICRVEDDRLVYKKQGVVWNFPASKQGKVTVKLMVQKSGVSVSLCDHWYNACDETVRLNAPVTIDFTKEMSGTDLWTELTLYYDTEVGIAQILVDGKHIRNMKIAGKWPNGLSYLHIQTLAEGQDMEGTLIKELDKTVEEFIL